MTAAAPARRTWYVKRTRWQRCENGDRVATCHHRPRCGPHPGAGTVADAPFGRWRTGWTRIRGDRQAAREAGAWAALGWSTVTVPTSPEVRAEVAAWQRQAKGVPRRGDPVIRHLCSGTNASMGGIQGGMRRGRKTTCPRCGRKIAMRPGRAGRLYPHSVNPQPGEVTR